RGCLASLSAKELDSSTQALAPKVGLELVALETVTCCGAGDIHEAEPDYYLHLNARILAYAEETGADTLLTICNVCTLNLRQANVKCCGFPIIQAREEVALGELIQPIEQALEAGADAMVTPCPLCHLSLDAWQSKLRKATGRDFALPILHLAQLVGVAAGLEEDELKFKRHVVSVQPVLEKLEV